VIIITFLYIS